MSEDTAFVRSLVRNSIDNLTFNVECLKVLLDLAENNPQHVAENIVDVTNRCIRSMNNTRELVIYGYQQFFPRF
jgi:hypothetical protein